MKKIITLLLSATIAATISSCGSGGGCAPDNVTPIHDTPIENPPGFIPATPPLVNEGETSTSVLIKVEGNIVSEVAVPVYNSATGSTQYVPYTVPTEVQTAIASNFDKTTYTSVGNAVIIVVPTTNIGGSSSVYVLVPDNSKKPEFIASGGTENGSTPYVIISPQITSTSNGQTTAVEYKLPSGILSTTNLVPVYQLNSVQKQQLQNLTQNEQSYKYPLSQCVSNPGIPTTVAITIYNGTYYVAAGTDKGTICAGNVSSDYSSVSWTELSSTSWTQRYQPRGRAINLSFPTQSAANILGFWNIDTTKSSGTSGNTIYRITGKQTTPNSTQFQPTSFWNVTINTKQYSSSTNSSIVFNAVPTKVFSMLADNNLNVYVGTTDGKVYKLANGFTTWSNAVVLSGVSGKVSLSPSSNGVGVIATGNTSDSKIVSYLIN